MIERLKRWYAKLAGFDYRMEEDRPTPTDAGDYGEIPPLPWDHSDEDSVNGTDEYIAAHKKPNRGRIE